MYIFHIKMIVRVPVNRNLWEKSFAGCRIWTHNLLTLPVLRGFESIWWIPLPLIAASTLALLRAVTEQLICSPGHPLGVQWHHSQTWATRSFRIGEISTENKYSSFSAKDDFGVPVRLGWVSPHRNTCSGEGLGQIQSTFYKWKSTLKTVK